MKNILLTLLSCASCYTASAQADTILVLDISTQTTATILPTPFNTLVTSDHSSSSPGIMPGLAALPQTTPSANVFSGSNFTKLDYAQSFFNLNHYPVRTVLRATTYLDTVHYVTSAMMVGPCFAMISAANITQFGQPPTFWNFDSILVAPAFNNGLPQSGLPATRVIKVFAFKSFVKQGNLQADVALLQLADPIGLQIGWTGMGFDSNPNASVGKIYHKFSYPSQVNPFDSSKVYNGDTLYYNYGLISEMGSYLGINSSEAMGIPGQAGSTFLYKDNSDYYSIGLALFSNSYYHTRINNDEFYRMQHVLNTQVCGYFMGVGDEPREISGVNLFPNPALTETTLQFDFDPLQEYHLRIVNMLGQELRPAISPTSGNVAISTEGFAPGIYFVKLQSGHSEKVCKLLVK